MSPKRINDPTDAAANERIDLAIRYIQSFEPGCTPSIRQVADEFNVCHTRLWRRLNGKTLPRNQAHENQQYLSKAAERAFVGWLLHLSSIGRPLSKRTITKKVQRICRLQKRPSRKWIRGFLKRHPEVRLGKPSGLDPKRAQAFNEATVERHFHLFREIVERYNIPWSNIYNMDEKGIQRGGGRKTQQLRYFIPRSRRPAYKIRSPNLELVTIIECVCADGTSLRPGFVFAGKEYHHEWFQADPKITIAMSPNGWTDDFLCTEWFEKSFIPQAHERNTTGAPILLVYDGHGSHTTARMVELAQQNNIHLFCLPPHTTHKLQPLDVGVFGPLQRAWQEHCDDVLDNTGEEIRRQDIVTEYMAARNESVHPSLVQSAWRKAGLRPINPNIFSPADFAPSASSSVKSHFPPSFPGLDMSSESESVAQAGASQPEGVSHPLDSHEVFVDEDTLEYIEHNEQWSSSDEGTDDELVLQDTSDRSNPLPPTVSLTADAGFPSRIGMAVPSIASNANTSEPHSPPSSPQESATASSSALELHQSHHAPSDPSQAPTSESTPSEPSATAIARRRKTHPGQLAAGPADKAIAEDTSKPAPVRLAAYGRIVRRLEAKVDELDVNYSMARMENEQVKTQLNSKESRAQRGKSGTIVVNSRCLTSAEGNAIWQAQQAEQQKRQQEREAARQQKEAQVAERNARRLAQGDNIVFSGGLSQKRVDDLRDIAHALRISTAGTRAELTAAIKTHFDKHPHLRSDPRFAGLFQRGTKRSHPHPEDATAVSGLEENKPPRQRRRSESPAAASSSEPSEAAQGPSEPRPLPLQQQEPNTPSRRSNRFYATSPHVQEHTLPAIVPFTPTGPVGPFSPAIPMSATLQHSSWPPLSYAAYNPREFPYSYHSHSDADDPFSYSPGPL